MKILVSGANGFLAGHIIHNLVNRGYEVRAMLRHGSLAPALDGLNIDVFRGNITDRKDVEHAVAGCSMVIHAAANTGQSGRRLEDYLPVNVLATQYLVEAMLKQGCKRMVYVSTSNTIGHGSLERPGTEGNPPSALFMKSPYARSKNMAEQMVLEAAKNQDMDVIVVNPGFMIGPMDFKPSSGKIFSMVLGRRWVFCPPGGKSFVDVRDAAVATVNALQMGESGSCYLLTGYNFSYHEFFKRVLALTHATSRLIMLPAWLLLLAGYSGSLFQTFGIKTSLHYHNARILCLNNFYDHSKAVKELNMPVTDIEKTLSEAIESKQ